MIYLVYEGQMHVAAQCPTQCIHEYIEKYYIVIVLVFIYIHQYTVFITEKVQIHA